MKTNSYFTLIRTGNGDSSDITVVCQFIKGRSLPMLKSQKFINIQTNQGKTKNYGKIRNGHDG